MECEVQPASRHLLNMLWSSNIEVFQNLRRLYGLQTTCHCHGLDIVHSKLPTNIP